MERIAEVFPEDTKTARLVAKAESSLNPNAVNMEEHNGCTGSYGLMQISCIHYTGNPNDLKDVDLNLKIARKIYERVGWSAWGVCKDGKVDCGL